MRWRTACRRHSRGVVASRMHTPTTNTRKVRDKAEDLAPTRMQRSCLRLRLQTGKGYGAMQPTSKVSAIGDNSIPLVHGSTRAHHRRHLCTRLRIGCTLRRNVLRLKRCRRWRLRRHCRLFKRLRQLGLGDISVLQGLSSTRQVTGLCKACDKTRCCASSVSFSETPAELRSARVID